MKIKTDEMSFRHNNTDGIAIKQRIARLKRKLRKTDFIFLKYVHGSVMK